MLETYVYALGPERLIVSPKPFVSNQFVAESVSQWICPSVSESVMPTDRHSFTCYFLAFIICHVTNSTSTTSRLLKNRMRDLQRRKYIILVFVFVSFYFKFNVLQVFIVVACVYFQTKTETKSVSLFNVLVRARHFRPFWIRFVVAQWTRKSRMRAKIRWHIFMCAMIVLWSWH